MQTAILITHRKVHRLHLQNTIITITFQFTFSHLFLITWNQLSICSYLYWCHKVSQLCLSPSVDTMQSPLVFSLKLPVKTSSNPSVPTHTQIWTDMQPSMSVQAHYVDAKASSASNTVIKEPTKHSNIRQGLTHFASTALVTFYS